MADLRDLNGRSRRRSVGPYAEKPLSMRFGEPHAVLIRALELNVLMCSMVLPVTIALTLPHDRIRKCHRILVLQGDGPWSFRGTVHSIRSGGALNIIGVRHGFPC